MAWRGNGLCSVCKKELDTLVYQLKGLWVCHLCWWSAPERKA